MRGSRRSGNSGRLMSMRSNVTSIAPTGKHAGQRRRGAEDDRSRALHAWSGERRAGAEGRSAGDAHSGQATASLPGTSLAGPHRPGAVARVGALDTDGSLDTV